MNRKTLARDAKGRFLPRVKPPAAPAATLWLPDYRWIAPSAADRALARSVVAAADAQVAAIAAQRDLEQRMALQVAARAHGPCALDGTAPVRLVNWGMLSAAIVILFVLSACMIAAR